MADHDHHGAIIPLTYYPAFCHKVSPTFFTWVKMAAVDVHRLKRRPGFEGMYFPARTAHFTLHIACQNLYFYLNHPIQFICAAGIIVARDEQERRSILVLDDSSGACLEIVCSKSLQVPNANNATITDNIHINNITPIPIPPTHLTSTTHKPLNITPLLPGARAKLKGTISCFRGMFQLHLERYEMLLDTNAEVRFWDERTRFRVQVLSVPWVVAQREVEKLRREAEGGGTRNSGDVKSLNGDGYVVARRRKAEKQRERERERGRRRMEREERDRLRIQRRYEREEVVREKLAARCREKSALVNRKGE
ncbi:hypothetical protein ACJ72_03102 [Emergomyces africanus]|uniref:CST complex subunit Stn1 N-terminal domain-containing protein n=1 Tax=Emergomyces africanus TaxID=1955775 RepID=A0A1B7P0J5_9EURO|nr:hypothetical protein ACJ72_03102 [Emergomyces africanus]